MLARGKKKHSWEGNILLLSRVHNKEKRVSNRHSTSWLEISTAEQGPVSSMAEQGPVSSRAEQGPVSSRVAWARACVGQGHVSSRVAWARACVQQGCVGKGLCPAGLRGQGPVSSRVGQGPVSSRVAWARACVQQGWARACVQHAGLSNSI